MYKVFVGVGGFRRRRIRLRRTNPLPPTVSICIKFFGVRRFPPEADPPPADKSSHPGYPVNVSTVKN
ncbi:hypothetical protein AMJ80_01725 [bacterium SM23_31]|nr:MAG: hypothetical protein AMJ80_01725 [bacterium SM23_31]